MVWRLSYEIEKGLKETYIRMANLLKTIIENDKKELRRLDHIAKKVEAFADQMPL